MAQIGFGTLQLLMIPPSSSLYMQPQILIALADVKAVDYARATGMSQTFDMHVHTNDGSTYEFSHMPQNEAPGLQQYMAKQGVAAAGGDQAPASTKSQSAAADASDSDSEEASSPHFAEILLRSAFSPCCQFVLFIQCPPGLYCVMTHEVLDSRPGDAPP